MTLTFSQTMPQPLMIVFSRRPRREIIRPYDARRRRDATAGKWGIVKVWAETLVLVVVEDIAGIAGAIRNAVWPPAYQFGGVS